MRTKHLTLSLPRSLQRWTARSRTQHFGDCAHQFHPVEWYTHLLLGHVLLQGFSQVKEKTVKTVQFTVQAQLSPFPQSHFFATVMIATCQMCPGDYHRSYFATLHRSAPVVLSVFINSSVEAVSGAKRALLAPWVVTLLALSSGRLLGKYLWTALQSNSEGRPTQIPVQPPSPEEQAWMGRLRSSHSSGRFNLMFF